MIFKNISAGLFSAREYALAFRETSYDKAEKIPRMIVNVTVTQHHRRPSAQTGRIKVYCRWVWARGDSYMKQTGMLVVSLRGLNCGFWSRLGCSGQSTNILSRQGLI